MSKRDYTTWQEGLGSEAKPDDYDQQPGKYEVELWCGTDGGWGKAGPNPTWERYFRFRVRLRQSDPKCQKQEPSTATGMVALWCEPGTTAVTELPVVWRKPQPEQQSAETDGEFMRRVLLPCICRIGVAKGAEHVEFNTTRLDRADALRLARIIAEAKP